MTLSAPDHPGVYLLTDHLDAALALGEDLLTERFALIDAVEVPTRGQLLRHNHALQQFLAGVHGLELAMTARVLEGRKRAQELKRREGRLRPIIALFVAGTATLVDAAAELGDTSARDFETGDTACSFLRSRNLIAPDAAGFERLAELVVGEDYLVAGRIRLGALLDLVASLLDALDSLFELYPEEAAGAARVRSQRPLLPRGPQHVG
jgi:hypothetical protein